MDSSTPTVYLIRHAKSKYNSAEESVRKKYKHLDSQKVREEPEYYQMKFESDLDDCDVQLNDPNTYKQLNQCRDKMSDIDIDLIVCSPLRRTLTTCYHVFSNHKSKAPIIVDPLFRQFLSSICDIGSRLQQSMQKYPDYDYSLIKNPSYWYVQTIQNKDVKAKILSELQAAKREEKRNLALRLTVEYIKDITERKKNNPSVSMEITSPIEEQKKRLKELLQKYKNIAVVTHNYNIETYTGTKTPNCGIFVYRSEFLELPLESIQIKYL